MTIMKWAAQPSLFYTGKKHGKVVLCCGDSDDYLGGGGAEGVICSDGDAVT